MSIGTEQLITPQLSPEDVRVFVAEDSTGKLESIIESLGAVGLDHSVTVARTYDDARAFVEAQTPHELDANVFLLDGNLDSGSPRATWQGSELAGILLGRYMHPLEGAIDAAKRVLDDSGVPQGFIKRVLTGNSSQLIRETALEQLHGDAFIAGVSLSEEGSLSVAAQIERIDYKEVGDIIFQNVLSPKTRKQLKILKQIADGDAIRATRAAKRSRVEPED